MRKLLKFENKVIRKRNNFAFIIKNYVSKYLIKFIRKTYIEQRTFLGRRALFTHQDALTNLEYCFSIKRQHQEDWALKKNGGVIARRREKVCTFSGRARGFIARVRVSRLIFRKLANKGLIVGERKCSF